MAPKTRGGLAAKRDDRLITADRAAPKRKGYEEWLAEAPAATAKKTNSKTPYVLPSAPALSANFGFKPCTYVLPPDETLASSLGNAPLYFCFAVKTHG